MGTLIDLAGQRFGRLTVVELNPERDRKGQCRWLCACDCGAMPVVVGMYLTDGSSRSCGCLKREMTAALGRSSRRETVKYAGAHRRVQIEKGPATALPCVDCGKRALQWSYSGGDPNELVEGGFPYSLDTGRYDPRCRSCHTLFDAREYRPTCIQCGEQFTAARSHAVYCSSLCGGRYRRDRNRVAHKDASAAVAYGEQLELAL